MFLARPDMLSELLYSNTYNYSWSLLKVSILVQKLINTVNKCVQEHFFALEIKIIL